MDIHVIINFEARPDRLNDFNQLLDQVKRELPQVPGCSAVRVFGHPEHPGRFTLLETWASQVQHRAHIEKVVASGGWAHLAGHLAADPVTHYVHEV